MRAEATRPELRWADLSEDEAAVLHDTAGAEDGALNASASLEVVEKLLGALVPEDRLVINLLHVEGRSINDVRELTGWNTAVVKIRAFRARQKLKVIFNKLLSEGKL